MFPLPPSPTPSYKLAENPASAFMLPRAGSRVRMSVRDLLCDSAPRAAANLGVGAAITKPSATRPKTKLKPSSQHRFTNPNNNNNNNNNNSYGYTHYQYSNNQLASLPDTNTTSMNSYANPLSFRVPGIPNHYSATAQQQVQQQLFYHQQQQQQQQHQQQQQQQQQQHSQFVGKAVSTCSSSTTSLSLPMSNSNDRSPVLSSAAPSSGCVSPAMLSCRGPWRADEDMRLRELVGRFGACRWSTIAAYLPNRSGKQARERWINQLNPALKKKNWSREEDTMILRVHGQVGNRWSAIAQQLRGRTDNAVKNRFNSTLKRAMREFFKENGAAEVEIDEERVASLSESEVKGIVEMIHKGKKGSTGTKKLKSCSSEARSRSTDRPDSSYPSVFPNVSVSLSNSPSSASTSTVTPAFDSRSSSPSLPTKSTFDEKEGHDDRLQHTQRFSDLNMNLNMDVKSMWMSMPMLSPTSADHLGKILNSRNN